MFVVLWTLKLCTFSRRRPCFNWCCAFLAISDLPIHTQRVFSAIPVGGHLCPVFCVIGFIGCVCLSVLSTRSVFWFSRPSMAWLRIIWVSSADQTPKTLLVIDFALQHAAISKFYASRRTSEAVHSLSPGRCSGTDFLQISGQTTRCRVSSLSLRHTISDSNHL